MVDAMVDTGSDLSLLRYDIFKKLKNPQVSSGQRRLVGIKESELTTIGSIEREISVDNLAIGVTFHVTRSNDLRYEAVLGNDILKKSDITFTEGVATFKAKGLENSLLEENKRFASHQIAVTDIDHNSIFSEFSTLCLQNDLNTFQSSPDLSLSHLSADKCAAVTDLINQYAPKQNSQSPVQMKIILSEDTPVYQTPRRVSYSDQRIIDEQVNTWLKEGIIQQSNSEYASPVVLVSKKDGTKRLCCDFRKLNEKITRDNFPMPLIDVVLERLQGAKIFSTLDLANGFFHVPVETDSKRYTSFVTHSGQYEFNFVPFGISNSPAVFCRYISAIFRELVQVGVIVIYMDDIIIPAQDEDEAIEKLKIVLKRAENFGLKVKWQKCQFLMRKINFLGYIIEEGCIKPSDDKVKAVQSFPLPRDKKSLQRFLGLTSYFRRFIEGYALVAKPLTDLLRKDVNFLINEEQVLAFQDLKLALVRAPVLKLYNPKAETEIHTDASMYGYGGVLFQKDVDDQLFHPIQYFSRKTRPEEQKYHSYELEVLAIMEALKKWRIYVIGKKIRIVSDCNAFALTMKKKEVPLRIARWAMYLQDFDYVIEHRPGVKMKHVDALSRMASMLLEDSISFRLNQAQQNDEWVKAVSKVLEKSTYEDFYIKNGILYKNPVKELVVVPQDMEDEIIRMAHNQGHWSTKKTQDYVEKFFYIPQIGPKVTKIIKNCVECIIGESKMGKREGLLSPIDKADKPLLTYHVDHLGPMELTHKKYNHLLVVVDAFSKFVWLYPTKSTDSTSVVEGLQKQSSIFGNPKRIVTDRGTAFTGKHFSDYCSKEGIQHLLIATGVPRGNGQVERINRIIIPLLTKLCHNNPANWYKHVDRVQRLLNNSPPRSTNVTPFKILTGLNMRTSEDVELRGLLEESLINELDEERGNVRKQALANISKIQEENKRTFNSKRKPEIEYNAGDLVAIKRTQYGPGLKLKAKFLVPYSVKERLAHGRYSVEKVGDHEGPNKTLTVAEYMKSWNPSFGSNDISGRPNVGGPNGRTRSGRNY